MAGLQSIALPVALAVAAVGAAAVGLGIKAVGLASDMEQSRIAFTTMLGSATAADAFIKQLYSFAASTPFEFTGLKAQAQQLLAFGFQSRDIIPMLTAVGDAMAGLGASQETMGRVVLALGQIQAKGKVSAQEMMQLAEAGVPAWQFLAEKIGVDIPTAMKMAENGAISAKVGIDAVTEGMEKRFGGMMSKQAGTVAGLWSNLQDSTTQTLTVIGQKIIDTFDLKSKIGGFQSAMVDVGAAITANKSPLEVINVLLSKVGLSHDQIQRLNTAFGALHGAISKVGEILNSQFGPAFQKLRELTGNNLDVVLVVLAGIVGGVLTAAFISLAIAVIAATWPLLLIGLAIGILAAGAYLIITHWGQISGFFVGLWNQVQAAFVGTWNAIVAFLGGVWSAITSPIVAVWNGIVGVISGAVSAIWSTIVGVFSAIMGFWATWGSLVTLLVGGPIGYLYLLITQNFGAIWDFAVSVFTAIANFLGAVWGAIVSIVMGNVMFVVNIVALAWNMVYTGAVAGWNVIRGGIAGIWSSITGVIAGPANAILGTLGGIWDSIYGQAVGAWNSLVGAASSAFGRVANAIRDAISGIHIPLPHINMTGHHTGSIAGVSVEVPDFNVDWYGKGGIFSSPSVIGVGEAGPEAVVPLSRMGEFGSGGGEVTSLLRQLLELMKGQRPIHVENHGSNLTGEDIGDAVWFRVKTGH